MSHRLQRIRAARKHESTGPHASNDVEHDHLLLQRRHAQRGIKVLELRSLGVYSRYTYTLSYCNAFQGEREGGGGREMCIRSSLLL